MGTSSYPLCLFLAWASAECPTLTISARTILCSGKDHVHRHVWSNLMVCFIAWNYIDCESMFPSDLCWSSLMTWSRPCCVWISLNKWMFCSALTFNLCSHLLCFIGCQICRYNWFLCHMQAGYVTLCSFRRPAQKIPFCTFSWHGKWLLSFVPFPSFLFCPKFADCAGVIISKGKVKRMQLCLLCQLIKEA